MPNLERLVHDLARTVVINKEISDLKQMGMEAEIAEGQQLPEANDLKRALRVETQRLKDKGTWDHEEVWMGTTIYSTGRTNGPKPKLENIDKNRG